MMARPLRLMVQFRRSRHVVGHRGFFLLFFAFLDIVYAFSLAYPPPDTARNESTRWVSSVAPLWVWATLWGVTGVVCLMQAFMRNDKLAFGMAVVCKVLWGTLFLLGWLLQDLYRGWLSAAIWLFMAALAGVVSTWPEPINSDPVSVKWPA